MRYTYELTNGPAAKQGIELFALGTPKPEKASDVVTSADFEPGLPSLPSFVKSPRYNRHAKYLEDLPPGKSAGPFGFRAPLLPGLTKAFVAARPGEDAVVEIDALSMWLAQKLEEAWKFENNTVQPIVVGPKIEIPSYGQGAQLLEAIRQEFAEAASLPEFGSERARLTALLERISGAVPDEVGGRVRGQRRGNYPASEVVLSGHGPGPRLPRKAPVTPEPAVPRVSLMRLCRLPVPACA